MAFDFRQILAGKTFEHALAELLAFYQDQGIQTTAWKPGDPSMTVLMTDSKVYEVGANLAAQNARNAINSLSSGVALTALSDSHFDNQRVLASYASGSMVVTGSALFGGGTFQPTELVVTDGTYRFHNQDVIVINDSFPFVTASFVAEEAGAEFNIPANVSIAPVQTINGLTVTNPPIGIVSGSWLNAIGVDEETDAQLRARNALKWSELQAGSTTSARAESLARSASSEIDSVYVDDQNPRGPGTADVYLAASRSTVASGTVAAVQTVYNDFFFGNSGGTLIQAWPASEVAFSRTITVYHDPSFDSPTILDLVETACDFFIAGIPIGGRNYGIGLEHVASVNDLVHLLEDIEGVVKVSVQNSNTDIVLAVDEKLIGPVDWSSLVSIVAAPSS